MPTLFRLLSVLAVIGLMIAAAIVALATMVAPGTREIRAPVTLPRQGALGDRFGIGLAIATAPASVAAAPCAHQAAICASIGLGSPIHSDG